MISSVAGVSALEILAANPTQFGIMQGRLVPPDGGRFQSFPRAGWREEFPNAAAAGIDSIEWIVDAYGFDVNPIFSEAGLAELNALKQEHDIATHTMCADWFMDYPLLRCSAEERAEREGFLHRLLPVAETIGARSIVLPFVDISRIETDSEKQTVVELIPAAAPVAQAYGVELHLETDLGPSEFAELLGRIPHPYVKANYDSGNSSGLGHIATEEFAAYGERIGSVHIKDRRSKFAGGIATMPLGEGSADLPSVFTCMREIGYNRPVTLQAARGKDGDEVNWIRSQLAFIRQYWK
ncbi:MAG: sugar phosphate isomerase/epimerase [Acidobacteriota bacterium]|nr:sugar phosphate isomerase/epimerase [Acidobacteriota bacterium]